jgi:hypothetical protein
MIPVAAQAGDNVCYFLGCPLPLVLRNEGSHHKLIGEAFIKDYMSLEAVSEMERGELKQMDFIFH